MNHNVQSWVINRTNSKIQSEQNKLSWCRDIHFFFTPWKIEWLQILNARQACMTFVLTISWVIKKCGMTGSTNLLKPTPPKNCTQNKTCVCIYENSFWNVDVCQLMTIFSLNLFLHFCHRGKVAFQKIFKWLRVDGTNREKIQIKSDELIWLIQGSVAASYAFKKISFSFLGQNLLVNCSKTANSTFFTNNRQQTEFWKEYKR